MQGPHGMGFNKGYKILRQITHKKIRELQPIFFRKLPTRNFRDLAKIFLFRFLAKCSLERPGGGFMQPLLTHWSLQDLQAKIS